MLRTAVITASDGLDHLREPWRRLVEDAPAATPFQTWEWQSTWMRHFGRGKQLRLFALYEGDDLVGLMPMFQTFGPWRSWRPVGVGGSDYLHPLARQGYEADVATAVAEWLVGAPRVDLVDLHQIRETQPLAGAVKADFVIEQSRCLVLDLPSTYTAYIASLGKSLRYDLTRPERSLFPEGRAIIRSHEGPDVRRGFEVFIEQHRMRWRRRGQLGAFVGRAVEFHQDWAKQAAERGWLRLSTLELDGSPVGSIYAMALGSTCYYYQAGLDPRQKAISAGTVLVGHAIKRAIEEGQTAFDFMRGDEPYKRRWKPQRVLKNYRLLFPRPTLRGQLAGSWNGAGSRVESRIRARLEGRGL